MGSDAEWAPSIGPRLRKLRVERELTLKHVSSEAGISEGFLSQIERDKKIPSFATLLNVLRVLNVPFATLVSEPEAHTNHLMRSSNRNTAWHGSIFENDTILTPPNAEHVQVLHCYIGPKEHSGREGYVHNAKEEVVYVLNGSIDVFANGERHRLASGDSLFLDPRQPHSYRNPLNQPSETLWIVGGGAF